MRLVVLVRSYWYVCVFILCIVAFEVWNILIKFYSFHLSAMYLLIYFPNEIEWIYYKKEYFPSESVVSTLLQRQIAPEIFNIFFRFFRFFLFFFQFFLIGEKLCHYKYKIKIAERTQNLSRCIARASSVFWSVFSNSSNSTFPMYILDSIQIWKKNIAKISLSRVAKTEEYFFPADIL